MPKNRGKCKSATISLHRGDSLRMSSVVWLKRHHCCLPSILQGLYSANLKHVSKWHIFQKRGTMPIRNMFQDGTYFRTARNTHNLPDSYALVKPRETQTHVERLMHQCMERAMHTIIELVAPIIISYDNYDYFVSQTLVPCF